MDNTFSTRDTTQSLVEVNKKKEIKLGKEIDHSIVEKMNLLAEKYSEDISEIIMVNKNEKLVPLSDAFFSQKIPGLGIEDYIKRILKYTQIEYSTFLLAMLYLRRICNFKKYVLSLNNIHRILMSCFIFAIKFNEDNFYKNTQYAKIGGLTLQELNILEGNFFQMIEYSLYVSDIEYSQYETYVKNLINS